MLVKIKLITHCRKLHLERTRYNNCTLSETHNHGLWCITCVIFMTVLHTVDRLGRGRGVLEGLTQGNRLHKGKLPWEIDKALSVSCLG